MAVQFMGDVGQLAVLDEASQFVVRHRSAAFAEVRADYQQVGFEVLAFCDRVEGLADQGRDARARQEAAQNRFELESEERRAVVKLVSAWFDKLHRAGRYAKAKKHPFGDRLPKLFFTAETDLESWRAGLASLRRVLVNLELEPVEWPTIGLPADFLDQGKALVAKMEEERDDAIEAESERMRQTQRLAYAMDELVDAFEEVHAARELAMAVTGKELPGLELSLVRAAAAPRRPTPTPTPASDDADTGL